MIPEPNIPKLPGVDHEVHFTRKGELFFIIPAGTALKPGADELWSARRGWFYTDVSVLSGYKASSIRGAFWMVRNLFVTTPRILWAVMTNKRRTKVQAQVEQRDELVPNIAEKKPVHEEQDLNLAFDRAAAAVKARNPEFSDTIEKLRKKVEAARRTDGTPAETDDPS